MLDGLKALIERDLHASWRRRIAYSVYDGLILPPSSAHPPTGFLMADRIGRLANQLGLFGPIETQILGLFREMERSSALRAARAVSAQEFKNRAVETFQAHWGIEPLAPYVIWRNSDILSRFRKRRQPIIMTSAHFGPLECIGAGLYQIDMPTMIFKAHKPCHKYPPGFSAHSTFSEKSRLTALLKLGFEHVRAGGNIFLTLEGWGNKGHRAPFLGRLIHYKRGALALARMTRVPLVPIVARWLPDGRLELEAHEPMPTPADTMNSADYEISLLHTTVRYLEGILKGEPESIRLKQLKMFLRQPPIT